MAIGRAGSFATDAPLNNNYIGNAITMTENQGFRYREERRKIADAKKAEEEAKNKTIQADFEEFDKKLIPTITGYSSIDDPINMYAMDVKQKGVEWIREKNQTSDPYKKAEIQSKIAKATNSFNMLNQYPKVLNEKKAELEDGIAKGLYNERDLDSVTEIAKSLDSGKYDMRVDENGVPRITIFKTDENGSPIGVLEKNISLGDIANRITPMKKPTYDINGGIAEQIVDQIKLDSSKVQSGFTTITQEKLDKEKENALKLKAKEVAGIKSEAFELWQRMGNPPKREFTEEDKAKISDYVYNDLKSRYAEKYERDIDQAGILAKKKLDIAEKEKQITIATASTVKEGGVKDGVKIQKGTKDFPLGNVIIKSGDGKEQKATNVYVSPGGKMFLRVEQTGFESASRDKFELTPSGKAKEAQAKAKAEKNKKPFSVKEFYDTLTPEDYKSEKISDKTPKVVMLDFGKDQNEIGRYALKMGYKGSAELQNDFIQRSGGDAFIITPDERNSSQPKKRTYKGLDANGNPIFE